jgi:hypothetical protein
MAAQRQPQQRRPRWSPHTRACRQLLLLLLAVVCACSGPAAGVLLSRRPGNVLTMILTDCAKYQDWQMIAAAFAWRQSDQPGSVIRVANCNEKDTASYDKRMLDYVDTHLAKQVCVCVCAVCGVFVVRELGCCMCCVSWPPHLHPPTHAHPTHPHAHTHNQYAWYEPLKDWYAAYNKPGAVVDYFQHFTPREEWVVVLDADMLLMKAFRPEELPLERGWAYAAHYDYLVGTDNGLALRHVPEVPPRCVRARGARRRVRARTLASQPQRALLCPAAEGRPVLARPGMPTQERHHCWQQGAAG